MSLTYTGQPQNVQLTSGGSDISASNALDPALLAALRPATSAQAVTLGSDFTITINSGVTRALYVGTGGNVKCTIGGTSVTFVSVPSGFILDVAATLVSSTGSGTTASDIVALG